MIEDGNRDLYEILYARNKQIRKLDKNLSENNQNIFDGLVLFNAENITNNSDLENQKRLAVTSWMNLDDLWNILNTDERRFWWVYKTADNSYKSHFTEVIFILN